MHEEDILTHYLPFRADLFATSETLKDAAASMNMKFFKIVHQLLCEYRADGLAEY